MEHVIDPVKLDEILKLDLRNGTGKSLDEKLCVMQAVDYITTGGFSDHPACACPILTNYAINLNDAFNDKYRQLLKPLIPMLVGTISEGAVKIKRKQFLMFRNVTATYPIILDLYKMTELAEKLRALNNSVEDMARAAALLEENKKKIYAEPYAYAYANADAYTDTYAYAYDYAYADANAYAYANALREKLANVAVETLKMACEIK